MANSDISAGFMGYIEVDGLQVRCSEFSPKIRQDVLFYDHIIGLRDSVSTDLLGSKGDDGHWNKQKMFYRAGVKIVDGGISFPMSELSSNAFFNSAVKGDDFDFTAKYSCSATKTFKKCKANTYSFSASAGEVPNVSIGIMGIGVAEGAGGGDNYDVPEKLITWDEVKISGINGVIASLEFNINNNCMPIYTAGSNNEDGEFGKMSARIIRVGMQQVTGSVTIYGETGMADQFVESTEPVSIEIAAGPFSATLNVLFQYPERVGSVSAYVRHIPFVGVDNAVQ